ncbi:MAG: hypothetical protein HRU41_41155 [Saprospiraceae bacterium]|nr:hypothetical protein [Saprospiraceae bacterium]
MELTFDDLLNYALDQLPVDSRPAYEELINSNPAYQEILVGIKQFISTYGSDPENIRAHLNKTKREIEKQIFPPWN